MLPSWVPGRVTLVYLTGVLEIICAAALFVPHVSWYVGLFLCVFLIAITPANIFAAIHRVKFGGHEAGPIYLVVRLPLQLFLIWWCYWFAVRQNLST